jgi:lipooligosaccharide transport system permease protein
VSYDWRPPRFRARAITVWRRNVLVWRKLIGPAILMNFGEPLIYLFGLGLGLGVFIGEMAGMSYLAFLATGIMASSAMTTSTFEGMYSVFTRMIPQKTYESLLATPLDIDDILVGELLWCGTKALLTGVAILLIAAALGAIGSWSAVLAVPVFFLVGLSFAGPAIVMSALAPNYDFFQYYFTLVITPMLMLSGVFFPTDALPVWLQGAVDLFPLTHAVELIRSFVLGIAPPRPLTNGLVLLAYIAIGHYLAVVFTRRRLLV